MISCACTVSAPATDGRDYIYFNLDRERIHEASFLDNPGIDGAQLKYTWPELEPDRDRYDFAAVERDLDFLTQHGKRLFVHIQDVSFEESIVNVPAYLREDPAFHGGMARQYSSNQQSPSEPIAEGWVARRWDPAVQDRFFALLRAFSDRFDGRVAGINLAETSIGFSDQRTLWPDAYTPQRYYEAMKRRMTAARDAFEHSDVIVYANFMPGESLPDEDAGYLKGIYAHAAAIGHGVGGPDLLPLRWYQRQHSLPLIAERPANVVAGMAVQWGNLEDRDRRTGRQISLRELDEYARDTLKLDYVFWGTQEPFYSRDILPLLASRAATLSTQIAATPHFEFHSDPWINLHHFLYQWARTEENLGTGRRQVLVGETQSLDQLDQNERTTWLEALGFYRAHVANMHHFDPVMLAIKRGLMQLEDGTTGPPDDIPGIARALATAMPVYEAHWWPEHDLANRDWLANTLDLLSRHENRFVEWTRRLYAAEWPEQSRRVDVSAYANPRAGYTSEGHIVIYSTDSGNQELYGLETLLHEVQHTAEVGGRGRVRLRQSFEAARLEQPHNLWHGLIFSTAGEFVRTVAAAEGLPEHQPYWMREEFASLRGWNEVVTATRSLWLPVLRRQSTVEEGFAGLAGYLAEGRAGQR